jgi:hypothetical protein
MIDATMEARGLLDSIRRCLGALLLMVILGGCGSAATPAATGSVVSSTASPTPANPSPACADWNVYVSHLQNTLGHMSEFSRAMAARDTTAVLTALRLAAADVRSAGDVVAPFAPTGAKRFERAASDLEQAATSASDGNLANATSLVNAATDEIKGAPADIGASAFCNLPK